MPITGSVVYDVRLWLGEVGIVDGVTGWPAVERMLHDGSDKMVVLTEDGGPPPEIPGPTGSLGDAAIGDCGLQVRVRGAIDEPVEAQEKAQEIMDALHGQLAVEMGYGTYMRVYALTPHPTFIGWDERRRPEYTQSFRLARKVPVPSV